VARADLIIDLTGTPGSSDFTVSFEGTLEYNTFVLQDMSFINFTPFASATFATAPITGSTQVSTDVSSITRSLVGIGGNSTSSLFVDVSPDAFVSVDDTLTFSGTGTFTAVGITFDDLTSGTYTGIGNGPISGPGDFTGTVTLNISAVPEPSTFTNMGLGLLGMAGYGWRRRRKAA